MKTSIMVIMAVGILGGVSAVAGPGATFGFTASQTHNGPGEAGPIQCVCTKNSGSFPSCEAAIAACKRIFRADGLADDSLKEVSDEALVAE